MFVLSIVISAVISTKCFDDLCGLYVCTKVLHWCQKMCRYSTWMQSLECSLAFVIAFADYCTLNWFQFLQINKTELTIPCKIHAWFITSP